MNSTVLGRSIQRALRASPTQAAWATLPALLLAAPAFAQQAGDASATPQKAQSLETIVVTGSRIRRVDLETANPVFAIDRAQIQQSGKLTIGDLVQEAPSVAGAAANPNVNNGGGDGASTVELRGLGAQRTLVLINGHRVIASPSAGGVDINQIPANLVERIEVLKDGASAVYGSDAIGGVVNIILRSNYQGAEFSADYGISDRNDGERRGFSATFGQTGDKGSVIAGINYNKFDPISSADRDYAKDATYLYSGAITKIGSSRTPLAHVYLPGANPAYDPNDPSKGPKFFPGTLAAQYGCSSVIAKPGATGSSQSDYRCYTNADSYNYQAVNLILTPQERTSAFALANYQLSDSVSAYLDVFHNKTTSQFAIAALPFDALSDGVNISAQSYYNPFGIDFGPSSGYNLRTRWTGLGQRVGSFATATDTVVGGLKGNVGDTSWQWDAGFTYGHISQLFQFGGTVYYAGLRDALGPSFLDTDGVVKCGTPGNVIEGCVPFNIFDQSDPAQTAALAKFSANPYTNVVKTLRQAEVNANGELFNLPAGTVSLAVGSAYRKEYQRTSVDFIAQVTDPATGTCAVSQSACASSLTGGFNVKEAYAELFVPVLKDLPFARALNVILGSRYSDYSNFGNTTNSKLAVEWRPIDDLLLRGTISEVFRAPNISELYGGFAGSAPSFSDPCVDYSGSGKPHACQYVPAGYNGSGIGQVTAVASGALAAGVNLKPELGKSFDWGFVYDPHWLDGFSVNVDVWRIYLNDTVQALGAQTIANLCFNSDTTATPGIFCNYVHRNPVSGDVLYITAPTVNLGRRDTRGVDFGFKYRLP
ncbi:TonB-dependent receptor plug domain-containing protein, partial [Mizugakiibacter sediminis]|uniref:TonB-dependent receptor plug domain-containing protein n=1 Tax=Mizugakiibacter sediminis TaxID=1475481 RepID=UPI0007836BBE